MKLCQQRRVNIPRKIAPLDVDLRSNQLPHSVVVELSQHRGGCDCVDKRVVKSGKSTETALVAHHLAFTKVRQRVDVWVEE